MQGGGGEYGGGGVLCTHHDKAMQVNKALVTSPEH